MDEPPAKSPWSRDDNRRFWEAFATNVLESPPRSRRNRRFIQIVCTIVLVSIVFAVGVVLYFATRPTPVSRFSELDRVVGCKVALKGEFRGGRGEALVFDGHVLSYSPRFPFNVPEDKQVIIAEGKLVQSRDGRRYILDDATWQPAPPSIQSD